jgi:tetrahydromethanopterin S-methyltransferase subunit F
MSDGRPTTPELVSVADRLSERGDQDDAETIAAEVEYRNNRWRRLLSGIKSALGWGIIIGATLACTYGFVTLVGSGKWVASAAVLAISVGVYAVMFLLLTFSDSIENALTEQVLRDGGNA